MTGGVSQGLNQTPRVSFLEHPGACFWDHFPETPSTGKGTSTDSVLQHVQSMMVVILAGVSIQGRAKGSWVWLPGISLLALISLLPWATGMSNHETFLRVDAGYRMPCPLECPPNIHNLMLCCWSREPKQRPCFKDLCEKLTGITRYENLV